MDFGINKRQKIPSNITEEQVENSIHGYLSEIDKWNHVCYTRCVSCGKSWDMFDDAMTNHCCSKKNLSPNRYYPPQKTEIPTLIGYASYMNVTKRDIEFLKTKFKDLFEWFETKCEAKAITQLFNDKAGNIKGTLVGAEYLYGVKGQNDTKDNTINIVCNDKQFKTVWDRKEQIDE